MEPTQQTPPHPLDLANEPHQDYAQFFDYAEFPKLQRNRLKRDRLLRTNPPGFSELLDYFALKVVRKDKGGSYHHTWSPSNLLLLGPAGKGKTTMACELADRVARMGLRVFYSPAQEMRRRYEHNQLDIDTFQEQFLGSRCLVIDNFENLMPGEEAKLLSWIKRRSDDGKWTIVIADMIWDPSPGAKNVYPVSATVIDYFGLKGKVVLLHKS